MIQIREGNEGDAVGLARVHVESWKSTYRGLVPDAYLDSLHIPDRAQNFRDWFRQTDGRFLYVALEGAEPIGFVSGGYERDGSNPVVGEIYAIYILNNYQRKGVGRRLFSASTLWLQGRGFKRIVLYSISGNPNQWFYSSLGGMEEACEKKIQIGGSSYELLKFSFNL